MCAEAALIIGALSDATSFLRRELGLHCSAEKIAAQLIEKFRASAALAAKDGIIPYGSENGHWSPSPSDGNSWWTGGFWPGLMWQLWHLSGDDFFMAEARRAEELLTAEFRSFRLLSHDVGFMYLLSCGADDKLTGREQSQTDTLHAASLLMGRFNPVGYIRAWNEKEKMGYAIIDCLMNLPLLFRAERLTGDPRYGNVARIHADTTLREFLRENGSVSHIIEFDPATGKYVRELPGQGYCLGSSWSRGQSWGLYGFTLMYMNTQEARYLDAARRIADYFISRIRPDGLTDCDFAQPAGVYLLDNIAGMCGACALIELSGITGSDAYLQAAEHLIDGVYENCCDWTSSSCGVLTHCTASYHDNGTGRHTNLMYADYFLTEAVSKLLGRDPMLWI